MLWFIGNKGYQNHIYILCPDENHRRPKWNNRIEKSERSLPRPSHATLQVPRISRFIRRKCCNVRYAKHRKPLEKCKLIYRGRTGAGAPARPANKGD